MSGNATLAADLSVVLGEAFSEALVVGIQSCEDENEPLSSFQKKLILSAAMSVLIDVQNRFQCILELDEIARECVGNIDALSSLHGDIVVEENDD